MPFSVKFTYHVNIILNEEGDPADCSLADNFCQHLLKKFEKPDISMYYPPRDMLGGISYFDALFDSLDQSCYTVVVLTPGFVKDGWSTYCQRAALKTRLHDEPGRYIPVAVGITKDEVPREISQFLKVLYFEQDFTRKSNDSSWEKLRRSLFSSPQAGGRATGGAQQQEWRVLTDTELTSLTTDLGNEWQMVAMNLKVTFSRIEQIRESYPNNVPMQIFASLWHWRQYVDGDEKTKLNQLVDVLKKLNKTEMSERLDDKRRLLDEGASAQGTSS